MTKPPGFELFDLRLYVAIVETGSLSKAAERLPLALSAASARLKTLESRLGLQLLKRGSQGMKATNAGVLFYDHALRLLQAANDAQKGMEALSGKGRIRLKLFCNTTGLSTDLTSQLGEFLRLNPGVDVQFEQHASRDVLKAVSSGKADIGVVDGDYNKRDLLYLLFQRNKLVVIAHHSSPLANAESCRFNEWLAQPLIGYYSDSSLQKFLEKMATLAHLPAKFRVTAPNFNAVAQLVAQDIGAAIVPRPLALNYASSLPISVIELNEPWATRELHICVRPQVDTTMPAIRLARYLAGLSENDVRF
ncbi:LysR substrate-binding domain-containing protein [Aliikangiella coralliicola]|uniref:LysR family transcriptional regulator n=1 Tax=Aliikangiella coralliicola TaxID=2592383 RepID=A0A545UFB0_9GAMM|nr:LysR substrate-binding domain-containing protein [Aliikangiella coralliicola]TQV88161.1 LysR family transcriptional regulator [Aliikangiella coralliicola]